MIWGLRFGVWSVGLRVWFQGSHINLRIEVKVYEALASEFTRV
jgi:hypothetical protein